MNLSSESEADDMIAPSTENSSADHIDRANERIMLQSPAVDGSRVPDHTRSVLDRHFLRATRERIVQDLQRLHPRARARSHLEIAAALDEQVRRILQEQ